MTSLATLPALAGYLREKLPEFGGRVLAVAESLMTKENVPTLPLAMLALIKEDGNSDVKTDVTYVTENFVVEFWLAPERYKKEDGSETGFWGFFDYDTLRDRVVSYVSKWKSPRGYKIGYKGLDITSTDFAIVVCLTFSHQFRFCEVDLPEDAGDGIPLGSDNFTFALSSGCLPSCFDEAASTPSVDECSTEAINEKLGI